METSKIYLRAALFVFGKIRQEELAFDAVIVEHPDEEKSVNVDPWFVAVVEGVEVLTQIEAVREEPFGSIISLLDELDRALELPPKPGRFKRKKPISEITTPKITMRPTRE